VGFLVLQEVNELFSRGSHRFVVTIAVTGLPSHIQERLVGREFFHRRFPIGYFGMSTPLPWWRVPYSLPPDRLEDRDLRTIAFPLATALSGVRDSAECPPHVPPPSPSPIKGFSPPQAPPSLFPSDPRSSRSSNKGLFFYVVETGPTAHLPPLSVLDPVTSAFSPFLLAVRSPLRTFRLYGLVKGKKSFLEEDGINGCDFFSSTH